MAKITGSPVLGTQGGRLYVPVGSWEEVARLVPTYECCTFQGSEVALNAATGQQIWKTYTIPERPRRLRDVKDLLDREEAPLGERGAITALGAIAELRASASRCSN